MIRQPRRPVTPSMGSELSTGVEFNAGVVGYFEGDSVVVAGPSQNVIFSDGMTFMGLKDRHVTMTDVDAQPMAL